MAFKKAFVSQGNLENPFKVSPSYAKWAPWIGPLTRASSKVLNTEYAKLTTKKSVSEQVDIDIAEERLSSELMNLKVNFNIVFECDSNAFYLLHSMSTMLVVFETVPRVGY